MDSVVPTGFRFNPSEEQLVSHFLKRKNNGLKEKLDVIPEVDVYKCEPWDLPDRSILPECDKQWYFFSPCDKKYASGSLVYRATEAGYWKATGRDHRVHSRSTSTGVRKTLAFYKGRPPRGEKTEWLMHEYHLDENECKTGAGLQNAFVLCHVLKNNELSAKIGGWQSAEIEKCDSSSKNGNPSCDKDNSEDRSKQLEEIQTNSSFPYMTEDGSQLGVLLGKCLDGTSSSSLSVRPGEDIQQVDLMPNGSGSRREFVWLPSNNNDLPQVPADISLGEEMEEYYDEVRILEQIAHDASQDSQNSPEDSITDIFNGGSSVSFESAFDNEGTGIQLRPRSPVLHSYEQDVSSEGTSNNNDFPQVPADISFGEEMDEYSHEAKILEEIVHRASQDSQYEYFDGFQVDLMPNGSGSHPEFAWFPSNNNDFPEDSNADILNGDYLELNDFENCGSSVSFEGAFDNEGTGIQLRARSPVLHSYEQDMSSEGTSKRRVRMQLHKMEASAGPNEKYATTADIHYASSYLGENQIGSVYDPQIQQLSLDSCGEHNRNLEIITQTGSSATGSETINRRDELSWCQKHEVIDSTNFSLVSNSADMPVSHSLTSILPQPSEFLNEEPLETIGTSLNAFETGVKHDTICLNKCQTQFQALSSSSSGTSLPVMSITEKIDKSNTSDHACFEECVVESELLHNSVNSVSESPKALPSQAAFLGENSTFGGSLANSGTPSLVLGVGKKSSAPNSSEGKLPASPNEGSKPSKLLVKILSCIPGSPASAMELPANLKSDKHIFGPGDASNFGSLSHPAINDNVTATALKKVPSEGIVEYSRLDTASSGLRARLVQESNNIVAGGEDKRREREACEHSSGTSSSSVQPRCLSSLFSQFGKRVSLTGSHGGVVLTCLFGTAFLFLFFLLSSIFCRFASTFKAVAF